MVGWCWVSSYDAGVLPAFAFVVVSCEPPSRLTTLQVEVTTFRQRTRSVRRTSGFVQTGYPFTLPLRGQFYWRKNAINSHCGKAAYWLPIGLAGSRPSADNHG